MPPNLAYDNAPADEARGAEQSNLAGGLQGKDSKNSLLRKYLLQRNATLDARLTKAALAVLAVLLEHHNSNSGRARPGCDRIASLTSMHRTTVLRAVALLESTEWIRVDRQVNRANEYAVGRWPTDSTWPTGSADATGSTHAPVATTHKTGSKRAQDRSHSCTKPVAQVRLESVLDPLENPSKNPLSLLPTADAVSAPANRFAEFWEVWPKRVDKEDAEKVWRANKLDKLADRIIADVRARIAGDPQWREKQYIPGPAKYLRRKRWEDEWQAKSAAVQASTPDAATFNDAALRRLGVPG